MGGELYEDKYDDTDTVIIGKVCNVCCDIQYRLHNAEPLRTLMIQHQNNNTRFQEKVKRDYQEHMIKIDKLQAERDERMKTREELREQKNNLKQVVFDCQAARPFTEGRFETRKYWERLLDNLMSAKPEDMNGVIHDIVLGMRGDFSTPSFTVRHPILF